MCADTAQKQQRRTARKMQSDRRINDAAESVAGLSPLIGASIDDIRDALTQTTTEALRQPILSLRYLAGYMGKLVDVIADKTDYQVDKKDRRFADESWQTSGIYRRLLQSYLAMDESIDQWVDELDLDEDDEQKVRFIVSVLTDSLAPTNTLLTNPTAMKKARATRGGSLVQGAKHFINDLRYNKGMPTQVDTASFTLGENLATTEGAVVFRNDILELIQYTPKTAKVRQIPLLVVPPQINKFYVFDLSPEKSLFRFLVEQGFQLFTVSWKNPTAAQGHWGLDDYITALAEAVNAVKAITGQPLLNLVGACSGGITSSILTSYLEVTSEKAINSLTLMVCVLSQKKSDSDITLFANDIAIENARKNSRKKGILDGKELARVFNWMRPNDLVWNYVINNYLLGNKPPAFDVLYWNNDSTSLPAQLHSDFLDQIQSNPLVTPGDLTVLDQPIDLPGVDCDKYIMAGTTDHITPWHACYRSTQFMGGDVRFILSNSGHIQSIVNPPSNPKASYFTNEELPASHEDWLHGAEQHSGTWWTNWNAWLQHRSGTQINARKTLGRRGSYPALAPAPGTYVME